MESLSFVACLLLISSSLAAITFDGLTASFAQFHRWQPSSSSRGIVGSLSFHFKTHNQDSLILYQDDGGIQDYLSIELSNGRVLATVSSNGKTFRVEIGQGLHDMNWHIIKIQLNFDRVTLTLDKRLTKTTKGLSNISALIGSSGNLYMGGLPSILSLSSLSWLGAVFKKGFVGCIKKFVMTNDKNLAEKAVLVKSKGTKSGCLNECRARNPCRNKGKCINRFPKAQCDCSDTGFQGERCEKEIVQLHLTKKDYVIYDMSSNPTATQDDYISIQFKTSNKNGLLLKTSFAHDFLVIKVYKGALMLEWNLGSGKLDMVVGNGNIHDNQWHDVNIKRTKRKVTAALDDGPEVHGMTPPSHSTFNMHGGESKVYIGGDKDSASRDQFVGCLKKVLFNSIELISKLKGKDTSLTLQGKALWSCHEVQVTTPGTTTVQSALSKTIENDKQANDRRIKSDNNIKTTAIPTKTKTTQCSPNDVRCVLNTFPPRSSTSNAIPSQTTLCKMFNNCSKGAVTTNRKHVPTSSTDNSTTVTASEPNIQGLEGADEDLGNMSTAIGLVVGSILLFVVCAIVSVKLKRRRDRKSHVHHEGTLEHREVDEMINTHVYHPDDEKK